MKHVEIAPTFDSWQAAARGLLRDGVPPADVLWREATSGAPAPADARADRIAVASGAVPGGGFRVPREFLDLARQAARHRDPARWQLLYEILWRLVRENRELLKDRRDVQVRQLSALAGQARREAYAGEVAEAFRLEQEGSGAAPFVPAGAGLTELRDAAKRCTGCDLYRDATQMVFGRGPGDARVVLVGEQPGDQEDLQGAPFVGPAGEVLDRALKDVGLARERLYVTNAVKHFKFVASGKRRIHQTPRLPEVAACRPWLEAELALIAPEVLVCLGATASRALLGADFRLMRDRGRFLPTRWAAKTIATLHPSAVLRGQDDAAQAQLYGMLRADLTLVASALSAA